MYQSEALQLLSSPFLIALGPSLTFRGAEPASLLSTRNVNVCKCSMTDFETKGILGMGLNMFLAENFMLKGI